MRLSAFIQANLDALAQEWEEYAAILSPAAAELDRRALRNSAAELLKALVSDIESPQSADEQKAKSQGRRPGNSPGITSYARRHAITRLEQGFTLEHVLSEYRALRATVLRQWLGSSKAGGEREVQDIVRFGESIDEAMTESLVWYQDRIEHARELFLGVLSHDLRTPLNTIRLATELLFRDENLSVGSTKAAVAIHNSGNRMSDMISDLLDFTRTRLGNHLPVDKSWCELGPMLRQTVEELLVLHPGRQIRYDCRGDLAGDWDVGRLQQMLSNLVGNALQHGEPDTPVTVLVQGEDEEVVVTVHNEGRPIAAEMINKIFDPLMRGVVKEAERGNRQASLGLGLYISREIAEAHGGDIIAASSPEEGTTFTVKLPRAGEARSRHQTTQGNS